MARAIRERTVSAKEVLEAHLAQIALHNPKFNAIVTLDEERARQRAKDADEAIARGENWGPLHGVPVTIKDFYATAGSAFTHRQMMSILGSPLEVDNQKLPYWVWGISYRAVFNLTGKR